MSALTLIRNRRQALAGFYDLQRQFEALEESCVPSYLHKNPAAAAISWWRLFAAARLVAQLAPPGDLLDFGAASGEFAHVLATHDHEFEYHFVEQDTLLADALVHFRPDAQKHDGVALPTHAFSCIVALDSLEHNENIEAIVDQLANALAAGGVLIVSGPTENWLYRLGRKIAGFTGDYHTTTIYEIEKILAARLDHLKLKSLPLPGVSLFRLSAWRKRS